jgi:N-acetyl-gamma-glutamyl-phosphate reductase
MKRFKAAIIGATGYGGAEMMRRLLRHPEVDLVRVSSPDHAGQPIGDVHLNLAGQTGLRFEQLDPEAAAEGCDIALLGLPADISMTAAPAVLDAGARVVDMSSAFRKTQTGLGHGPRYTFVYGLPELNRDAIRRARAVASPGCFATAMELALLPLARGHLLTGSVTVVGITGSSGSGVTPSSTTHHPMRALNLKSYRPLQHPQAPEVEATLRQAASPRRPGRRR